MKTTSSRLLSVVALVALLASPFVFMTPADAATASFFVTGGPQSFTVPAGVTSIDIDASGAAGEGTVGLGGSGARAVATLPVTPGQVIQIMVGGAGSGGSGGFNGGGGAGFSFGLGPGGAGGGATDIRTGACAATLSCGLAARVVVAGGGGGSEGGGFNPPVFGGSGGLIGSPGSDSGGLLISGGGGQAASGGSAGGTGSSGSLGQGGFGGNGVDGFGDADGGGGGGGYYGGGGGGGGDVGTLGDPDGGSGGGGSSFGPGGTAFTSGFNAGSGQVTITYVAVAIPTTTTIISSDAINPSVSGQGVSFTAAVSPIPSGGSVQFRLNGLDTGGPIPVDGAGEATSAAISTMSIGAHSLTAVYSGNPSYLASTSGGFAFSVTKAATSAAVSATPATAETGQAIVYTASISVDAPGSALPAGTVAFTDNGLVIAGCGSVSVTLAFEATCSTTAPSAGTRTVVAAYGGSADLLASSASSFVVITAPPGVTTTTSPGATTAVASTTTPGSTAPGSPTTTAPPASPTPTAFRTGGSDYVNQVVTTAPSTSTTTASSTVRSEAVVAVVFSVEIDTKIEGTTAEVSGSGFHPNSLVSIVLFSEPTSLGSVMTNAEGSFGRVVTFPAGVEPGDHRVEVSGLSQDSEPVSYTWYLELNPEGIITELGPEPLQTPPDWYGDDPVVEEANPELLPLVDFIPPYDVTEHAPFVVATMVSGFALLTILSGTGSPVQAGAFANSPSNSVPPSSGTPSGSASPSSSGSPSRSASPSSPGSGSTGAVVAGAGVAAAGVQSKRKLGSAGGKHHSVDSEDAGWGDLSYTWDYHRTHILDKFSKTLPPKIANRSPLLGRILADSVYLRAMFGSMSLVAPFLGLLLGIVATRNVGGQPIPPALWIMLAIVVLGIMDAFAGLLAAVVFTIGAVLGGDVFTADAIRGLLGLNLLMFALPLAGSKVRPLRRDPSRSAEEHYDRLADVVIVSLIVGWAAKKLVGALPGLAALDYPIAERSGTIALVALAAMALRMGLETIAMWLYPQRLEAVTPEKLPKPDTVHKLIVLGLQTCMFVFVAYAFLGSVWELWAGAALFAVPQLISLQKDRLPNVAWLTRLLPGGILKTTLMMIVGTLFAGLVSSRIEDPARFISIGFVVLGFPGLVLTFMSFFGRDGKKWEMNWLYRIGGIAVLAVGVSLAEKIITIG